MTVKGAIGIGVIGSILLLSLLYAVVTGDVVAPFVLGIFGSLLAYACLTTAGYMDRDENSVEIPLSGSVTDADIVTDDGDEYDDTTQWGSINNPAFQLQLMRTDQEFEKYKTNN